MTKGQLSIDLLLAIIAATIFFSAILNITNNELSVRVMEQNTINDAHTILLDAYAAIGTVKANNEMSFNYVSPKPKQKENIGTCKITKSTDSQSLTVTIGSQPQTKTYSYSTIDLSKIKFEKTTNDTEIIVSEFNCGELVKIYYGI